VNGVEKENVEIEANKWKIKIKKKYILVHITT
jgi:hypothetical protein